MFGFLKKMFIRLLISTVNDSNHTKCMPINNQQCILLTKLFHMGINTDKEYVNFEDMLEVVILLMIYLKEYVFQIKEDLNLNVFNIITEVNVSKILTKHISFKFACKFDGRKCNSNQK